MQMLKKSRKKFPGSAPLSGSVTKDSRVYSVQVLWKYVQSFLCNSAYKPTTKQTWVNI